MGAPARAAPRAAGCVSIIQACEWRVAPPAVHAQVSLRSHEVASQRPELNPFVLRSNSDLASDSPVAPAAASPHGLDEATALTSEQRRAAEVEHALQLVDTELVDTGELVFKLGGDRGTVSGSLTPSELAALVAQLRQAADQV
jgi:hypothetical protein